MDKEFLETLSIIVLIWGILNIILFFKIWGMTNDVKELKNFILGRDKGQIHRDQFKIGDVVINISTHEELRILGSYKDGTYFCCDNNTNEPRGIIQESLLKTK